MIAAICEYVCQHMDLREFDLQNVCTCEGCVEFVYRLTPQRFAGKPKNKHGRKKIREPFFFSHKATFRMFEG